MSESIPGAERFVELCNRLYKDLNECNGGPLHAQLEDENIDRLVGEHAKRQMYTFINALNIIAQGQAPTQFDYRFREEYSLAHFYRDQPEVLKCGIEILKITQTWSEDQAWEVYEPWSETIYGKDGTNAG